MLREPKRSIQNVRVSKRDGKKRFQIQMLEERIAPKRHVNPQGNYVGGGRGLGKAA